MARCGPELQLGVAARPHLEEVVVSAVVQLDVGHDLGVAAIEAFRETENGRKRADDLTRAARQIAERFVAAFGRRLAMVARDQRNRFDFFRLEAAKVAVLDQVVRMLVMALVADVDADVVEQGGVLQPLALAIGEAVDSARLVEQREREARDLL